MNKIEETYKEKHFYEIEKKYNLKFDDKELLVKAFTHGSFNLYDFENYQRLEFLGDAVLQMVVSDYMYRNQTDIDEGGMSKERGALVSEHSLAFVVKKENLDKYILYGKSIKKEQIENTTSYVADIYEALVAAIYLDQGYLKAERFIKETLINCKDKILDQDILKDYKTLLQEKLQVNGNINLKYDSKSAEDGFRAIVKLEGTEIGQGFGKTKKLAEQQAAKKALKNMV